MAPPKSKFEPKQISKMKNARRDALLKLTAKRMGFTSWSNFSSRFTNALSALPPEATETDVNNAIYEIISDALKHILHDNENKKTADSELKAIFKANPLLRPWTYKKK